MKHSNPGFQTKKLEKSMRLRLHAHTGCQVFEGKACAPLRNVKTAAMRAMLVPAIANANSKQ
jgi:hypothetical protein